MKPIIVLNFKTYRQGMDVLKLAKEMEKVDKGIILGISPEDVYRVSSKVKNPIYVQHVDPFKPGRNTGYVLPESIKEEGAKGVFLNHSEHKLAFKVLKESVKICKQLKLKILIFASNLKEAKKIQKLKPDYLVIEPPELVAGKKSVSESKPDLIRKIKKNLKSDFLVGAGIHTKEDTRIALELGASGIALSSAITTSKTPGKKIREIIR